MLRLPSNHFAVSRTFKLRKRTLCCAVEPTALVRVDKRHYRRLQLDSYDEIFAHPAPSDFYQLLNLELDDYKSPLASSNGSNTASSIKAAYRRLQKLVHPDLAGESAAPCAALLNLAYVTLSDDNSRAAYDLELRDYRRGAGNFDGRPVSFWAGPEGETRAIFVDESTCIGCKQCTVAAPNTFFIEEEWGRARVGTQWGDEEEWVNEAVAACPVDCIHFVDRDQLPIMEFVMKSCRRENIATMARRRSGNMGSPPSNEDPFKKAETFVRQRRDAKLDEVMRGGRARLHDEQLAAAIAKAWLSLPPDVRFKGYPRWAEEAQASIDEADAKAAEAALAVAAAATGTSSSDSDGTSSSGEFEPQSKVPPAVFGVWF